MYIAVMSITIIAMSAWEYALLFKFSAIGESLVPQCMRDWKQMSLPKSLSLRMTSCTFMQIYLHVHMACYSQPKTVAMKETRNGMATGIVTCATATVMVDDT